MYRISSLSTTSSHLCFCQNSKFDFFAALVNAVQKRNKQYAKPSKSNWLKSNLISYAPIWSCVCKYLKITTLLSFFVCQSRSIRTNFKISQHANSSGNDKSWLPAHVCRSGSSVPVLRTNPPTTDFPPFTCIQTTEQKQKNLFTIAQHAPLCTQPPLGSAVILVRPFIIPPPSSPVLHPCLRLFEWLLVGKLHSMFYLVAYCNLINTNANWCLFPFQTTSRHHNLNPQPTPLSVSFSCSSPHFLSLCVCVLVLFRHVSSSCDDYENVPFYRLIKGTPINVVGLRTTETGYTQQHHQSMPLF